jgi:hypothetical protein
MIDKTVHLLGHRATDKITGFAGVISSVCFDLYGCVQCALTPPIDKDGKIKDGHWFDVSRLTVSRDARAMPCPDFAGRAAEPADYDHGAAEKPHKDI